MSTNEIVEFPELDPDESPSGQLRIYLNKIDAFRNETETMNALPSVGIFDTEDTSTNLSATMVYAKAYDNEELWVGVEVQNHVDGHSYYVKFVITAQSGRKYAVVGRFTTRSIIP